MQAVHIKLWEGIQENDELRNARIIMRLRLRIRKKWGQKKYKNKKKMRSEEIEEEGAGKKILPNNTTEEM